LISANKKIIFFLLMGNITLILIICAFLIKNVIFLFLVSIKCCVGVFDWIYLLLIAHYMIDYSLFALVASVVGLFFSVISMLCINKSLMFFGGALPKL
jgi:hypothetical protein